MQRTLVAAASGNSEDYSERFKTILAQQAELKVKRAELEQQQAEDAELTSHMKLAADTLIQADTAIMKWDEYQIRALVESVRILSNDEILVRLKSGIEKIERLQKQIEYKVTPLLEHFIEKRSLSYIFSLDGQGFICYT